ncbi:hypothetical protein Tco_1031448 [Tanacetum coccineum]|uniref:Uncharacterized protein n=1 Tax=Tanacetum coccineum TaxID=301880 RepID=A0ABQ5GB01_9ASTR
MHRRFEKILNGGDEVLFKGTTEPPGPQKPLATKPKLDVELSGETRRPIKLISRLPLSMGLWYPREFMALTNSISDAGHAGCLDTRKRALLEGYSSL